MNMKRLKRFTLLLKFDFKKLITSIALLLTPLITIAATSFDFSSLPGEIYSSAGGVEIRFDDGRLLRWQGGKTVVVQSKEGKGIVTVDLSSTVKKESGTEALGLGVEETDLGGSLSSKKKYLTGKKDPKGRGLDASQLKGVAEQGGSKKQFSAQGISMTTTEFPNGASLLKINWPASSEDDYFDKRRSLISSEQIRKAGDLTYTLKQWTNGSFLRSYQRKEGEVQFLYDNSDESYRYTFLNAKGEVVQELGCSKESCEM